MKSLRKTAGITVILILVFMVIALFQYQTKEDAIMFPDQIEFYMNEEWSMVSLDGMALSGEPEHDRIGELVEAAMKAGDYEQVNLPFAGMNDSEDAIVFLNLLPAECAGLTMNFSSADAHVCVFLNGEMVYQYEPETEEMTGIRPGSYEHFVDIPKNFTGGEVWIELVSPYPDAAATLGGVMIETRDVMVIGVFGNSIADIGCCLLIIIMAIIMFVLVLIRWYTQQPSRGEIFLGLTGLAAGIYCFIGTDTLSIFYNVQEAYEMQEYLVLLLPLFLILYFERNLHTKYPRRFSVLLCIVSANAEIGRAHV